MLQFSSGGENRGWDIYFEEGPEVAKFAVCILILCLESGGTLTSRYPRSVGCSELDNFCDCSCALRVECLVFECSGKLGISQVASNSGSIGHSRSKGRSVS